MFLKNLRFIRVLGLVVVLAILAGCAAVHTSVSKRELDVQTRTSTAIFVDPVSKDKRTIYLDVRSGVMEFDRRAFKTAVKSQISEGDSGYQLVDDPDGAQFHLSVYVLNLEKTSPSAAEAALNQGYTGRGEVVAGAAVGAVSNSSNPVTGGVVGGVLAGGATVIGNAFVKDVTFMLVADVQIKERAPKGVIVRKDSKVDAKISDSGTSRQTFSEVSTRKEYRTRIVTTANKANLKLEIADKLMFDKTAYAMAGFF